MKVVGSSRDAQGRVQGQLMWALTNKGEEEMRLFTHRGWRCISQDSEYRRVLVQVPT